MCIIIYYYILFIYIYIFIHHYVISKTIICIINANNCFSDQMSLVIATKGEPWLGPPLGAQSRLPSATKTNRTSHHNAPRGLREPYKRAPVMPRDVGLSAVRSTMLQPGHCYIPGRKGSEILCPDTADFATFRAYNFQLFFYMKLWHVLIIKYIKLT